MKRFCMATLSVAAFASVALGQVRLNELLVNPVGTDQGFEFFELRSTTPSQSLSGLWLLGVEGDGTAAGTIDVALNLSSFSTGSNGLFLWRDTATVLSPAPEMATTINVADFVPDLENGTQTFILVSGFTGATGLDLDTNNDGTLDVALPWGSVLDSITLIEDDGTANFAYADELGGVVFPQQTFSPDAYQLFEGQGWVYDILGTGTGPFTSDPLEVIDAAGTPLGYSFTVTPGSANVPEPASLVLVMLGLALRRR